MILPYHAEPMTAGELRNKLRGVSNDTPVYVVVDKSDGNYDEDGCLIQVHPVMTVEREWICECNGFDDTPERNLIIHLDDKFYENYECGRRDGLHG